jgi:ankyrin repeat protein
MNAVGRAARLGDLSEVQRLIGQEPRMLDAFDGTVHTPLMHASTTGHVRVVQWLLDQGASINHQHKFYRATALWCGCHQGCLPVVKLLLERGADPTLAEFGGTTPLIAASGPGQLEVVRLLLAHPIAKTTLNHRANNGDTALWGASYEGRGGVVRALLESGADPTIVNDEYGTTPMAVAKEEIMEDFITPEGRRECIEALEVKSSSSPWSQPWHALAVRV